MPRAKNAVASRQKRKKVMKQTKGYFGRRKNVWTVCQKCLSKKVSVMPIVTVKRKKPNFRALWIQRINAAVREHDMSYSEFMGKLSKAGIEINRKVLADLAMNDPKAFEAIVKKVQ